MCYFNDYLRHVAFYNTTVVRAEKNGIGQRSPVGFCQDIGMKALRGLDLKERGAVGNMIYELAGRVALQNRVGRGYCCRAGLVILKSFNYAVDDLGGN